MDDNAKGAWIVHHTHKLDRVRVPGRFVGLRVAGKSGVLLSSLCSNEDNSLTTAQVEALATAAQVDPYFELPQVLRHLADHQLIEQHEHGIEVIGLTTPAVLQHTSNIFNSANPSQKQIASLQIAEECSKSPLEYKTLHEYLSDSFRLPSADTNSLLQDAKDIGFADTEKIDGDTELFFNGNLFRRGDIRKITAVLDSLTAEDRRKVENVNQLLESTGCETFRRISEVLGKVLFEKLLSVGFYDLNKVSNSQEMVVYVTKPSAFAKFGNAAISDAFDLAKAFVASLSYGIHRSGSNRGRIKFFGMLIDQLIRGQWVGPATAIGQDYKILETKNVIRVRPEGSLYSMKLLKREVGELAKQVITEGDASVHSLPGFPGAAVTQYTGPEEQRYGIRVEQREQGQKEINDILSSLRTGRDLG